MLFCVVRCCVRVRCVQCVYVWLAFGLFVCVVWYYILLCVVMPVLVVHCCVMWVIVFGLVCFVVCCG